jgi:hypothetical protein
VAKKTNSRYRDKEALIKDLTHVLNAPLTHGTKYAVADDAAWKWTEFEGKYDGCIYWSETARVQRSHLPPREDLQKHFRHEHSVPKTVVIKMLLDLHSPTEEQVKRICEKFLIGVVVTIKENDDLNRAHRQKMPDEFFDPTSEMFHDPLLRYKVNEIRVVCTATS